MPSMARNAALPTSPLSRSALTGDTTLSLGSGDEGLGDIRSRPLARRRLPSASTSRSPCRRPLTSSTNFAASSPSCSSSPSSSNWLHKRTPTAPPSPVLQQQGHTLSSTAPATPRPGRRRSSHHYSTSPTSNRPLIGSYSESLLSGRMSTNPSMPFPFQAELGVLGALEGETPRHLKVDFDARFYAMPEESSAGRLGSHWGQTSFPSSLSHRSFSASYIAACTPSTPGPSSFASQSTQNVSSAPYVGTIDLDAHYHSILSSSLAASRHTMPSAPPVFPGYAVPSRGQVQLLVKNPHLQSAVKLFLVPYDLRDMPTNTKTFIRKKICVEGLPLREAGQPGPSRSKRHSLGATGVMGEHLDCRARESLRYAVHLQFVCVPDTSLRSRKTKRTTPSRDWTPPDAGVASHAYGDFFSPESVGGANSAATTTASAPRYFLYRSIRVVFSPRPPEKEDSVKTYIETPAGLVPEEEYVVSQCQATDVGDAVHQKLQEQSFSTYSGNSEEWEVLRKKVLRARKEWKLSDSKGRKSRAESHDPDASNVSLASIADSSSAAEESAISMCSDPFRIDDVGVGAGLDGRWADGQDELRPTSPPVDIYAPNPDPDGELWQEAAVVAQGSEDGVREQVELHQRWNDLTIGHQARIASSSPPRVGTGPTTEQVSPPHRPLRRQRSRTITPTPAGEARDAAAARRSIHPPSARSLPVSPGMSSRRPACPATAAVAPTGTARPASPSLFAPPLSLQRLSIRPASPSLAATTPTNVSGVTSPRPALLSTSTPHSTGVGTGGSALGTPAIASGGSYTSSLGRGAFPHRLAARHTSSDRLDLQMQMQAQEHGPAQEDVDSAAEVERSDDDDAEVEAGDDQALLELWQSNLLLTRRSAGATGQEGGAGGGGGTPV